MRQTATDTINISYCCVKLWRKRGLDCKGAIWPSLVPLIFGLAFRILEDLGLEKSIVGVGCTVEKPGTLSVELQRRLKKLQGIIDLER